MRLWPRRLAIGRRKRRGLIVALIVVNQFVVASGLPLPVSAATPKKDLSKPFPCMYMSCGCMNADQCWHSCCCFSMREKLAWAEAHGIEPPEFVREAAAEEARDEAKNSARHAAVCGKKHCGCCCCCCKDNGSQTCGKPAPEPAASHSASSNSAAANSATVAAAEKPVELLPPPEGKSVILLMALGCQGQSVLSILALALPAIVPMIRRYEFLPVADICICERSFESIRFSPPVPPPERSAAANLQA